MGDERVCRRREGDRVRWERCVVRGRGREGDGEGRWGVAEEESH